MKNEYLKELKESCKLTTKQISSLSGVPESTISRILSGQTDNPTFDSVCAIVNAMGGSLDKLTEIHTDSHAEAASPLLTLYEKVIAEKNWYIKVLIGICCALVAILVFLLIFDIANGWMGFVRY